MATDTKQAGTKGDGTAVAWNQVVPDSQVELGFKFIGDGIVQVVDALTQKNSDRIWAYNVKIVAPGAKYECRIVLPRNDRDRLKDLRLPSPGQQVQAKGGFEEYNGRMSFNMTHWRELSQA